MAFNGSKIGGHWQDNGYGPTAGQIPFFDWEGDGATDYVGTVEKYENGIVYTKVLWYIRYAFYDIALNHHLEDAAYNGDGFLVHDKLLLVLRVAAAAAGDAGEHALAG